MESGVTRPILDGNRLGETITWIAWARDPATVNFQTRDSLGIHSYWGMPTAGGTPRRLLRLAEPGRRSRRIEFDTDARNLYFTISSDEADVAVMGFKKP